MRQDRDRDAAKKQVHDDVCVVRIRAKPFPRQAVGARGARIPRDSEALEKDQLQRWQVIATRAFARGEIAHEHDFERPCVGPERHEFHWNLDYFSNNRLCKCSRPDRHLAACWHYVHSLRRDSRTFRGTEPVPAATGVRLLLPAKPNCASCGRGTLCLSLQATVGKLA